MGKRSGPNGFFLASEKGTTAERECCDIGLGLMMTQTQQSFPRKKMMINNTSGGGSFGGETCGVGGNGTLFCNPSNPAAAAVTSCMMSDIYNVAVGSDFGSVVPKSLQQPYSDTLSFSSSVGGMVRVPFTAAQREELERQTMIYKYMMASVPVPPQLLVPFISKNLSSNVAHLYPNLVRGALELGISSNSDPEPWRCKRTDGKKWRCSRDVAPDQKYCERHAHKKRIRSRKPVESHPNFINTTTNTNMRSPRSHFLKQHNKTNQPTPFSSNTVSSTTTSHGQPRSLAWFMNGETPSAAGSDQEWEQMMQFKVDLKSCCYTKSNNTDGDVSKQQNESSLNLYRGYPGDSQGLQTQRPSHNDQYGLLLTPKLAHFEGALNSNQTQQQTRHFIDAWSTPERDGSNIGEISNNRGYVSPNQNLPFSSLTLSMSRGNENYETNEESESSTQMGLGILGSERENGGDLKSQWMNPLSWMSSPPGGPLAEALCLGITSSTRAASSNGCNSGSTSCRSSSGDVRQEFDLIN